jgi:hypothetical protein
VAEALAELGAELDSLSSASVAHCMSHVTASQAMDRGTLWGPSNSRL